jgi:uncharacterized protein (DUF1697 family)
VHGGGGLEADVVGGIPRDQAVPLPSKRRMSSQPGKGVVDGLKRVVRAASLMRRFYSSAVAIVVFLRGINVGGHRRFRPSLLARELGEYDVVNVGATGTFVVRRPGARARFRAELVRRLPFQAEVVFCEGRDLLLLAANHPFGARPPAPEVTRFVTVLARTGRPRTSLPVVFPEDGAWLVRVIAAQNRFVFGEYRRDMKTIGYLGQIDRLFGVPATTRSWTTINAIARILEARGSAL